jgi:hypothetical protein
MTKFFHVPKRHYKLSTVPKYVWGAKGRQKCFRITGAPAQNLLIYPQRTTSSNPKLSVLLPEIETVKFHFRSITCSPQMTPNRSIYFALEALNPRFPNLNNSPAPQIAAQKSNLLVSVTTNAVRAHNAQSRNAAFSTSQNRNQIQNRNF